MFLKLKYYTLHLCKVYCIQVNVTNMSTEQELQLTCDKHKHVISPSLKVRDSDGNKNNFNIDNNNLLITIYFY